jgi:hypothetical protein
MIRMGTIFRGRRSLTTAVMSGLMSAHYGDAIAYWSYAVDTGVVADGATADVPCAGITSQSDNPIVSGWSGSNHWEAVIG